MGAIGLGDQKSFGGGFAASGLAVLAEGGNGLPAEAEKLLGGCESGRGLEVFGPAQHGVYEEVDEVSAVAGLGACELGQSCDVFAVVAADDCAAAVCAAAAGPGVSAEVGDECAGVVAAELEEQSRGVDAVGGFGAVDAAFHGVDEEADDHLALVGVVSDELGERVPTGYVSRRRLFPFLYL